MYKDTRLSPCEAYNHIQEYLRFHLLLNDNFESRNFQASLPFTGVSYIHG